jgi:hypothetical protein
MFTYQVSPGSNPELENVVEKEIGVKITLPPNGPPFTVKFEPEAGAKSLSAVAIE